MASKGFQETYGCGQTAETIFAAETPKQTEEADRLFSLRRRLGDSFGNCLEASFEPFRLDAPQNSAPKQEIPDGANGFGRSGSVDHLLQNFVTRRQGATHDLQHTAFVQFLEDFVCGQDSFSVFFRSLLQSRAQLGARVARRNF